MAYITWFTVFVLALAGIIIYFLLRIRQKLKNMVGATNKMNTIALIKNWQEQKAKQHQEQEGLRQRAYEAAKPEIEAALIEKYKRDAIKDAMTPQGDRFKSKLKEGLGIDIDKVTDAEHIDRLIGRRRDDIGGNVERTNIFDQDRLREMSQTNAISRDKLKGLPGEIDWGSGVRRALDNDTKFEGVRRALNKQPPNKRYPPKRV